MKQYEIWWASLPGPIGRRPVLLLSRTPAYAYLWRVLVADITTQVRSIPQEGRLGRSEGLARVCVANLDNVHAIGAQPLPAGVGAVALRGHGEVQRDVG